MGFSILLSSCLHPYLFSVWGLIESLAVVPQNPSALFPEIGYSHWDLALNHSDMLAGQLALEILLSLPPLLWDYIICWQAQIFTVVLGIKLRSLWLHNSYHMYAYRPVVIRTFTLFSNDHHVYFHNFSFPNWKPVPLNTSSSLFPSLIPGNPLYTFSLCVCD